MRHFLKLTVRCTDGSYREEWKRRLDEDLRQCRQAPTDLRVSWNLSVAVFTFEVELAEVSSRLIYRLRDRVRDFAGRHGSIAISYGEFETEKAKGASGGVSMSLLSEGDLSHFIILVLEDALCIACREIESQTPAA